VVHTVIRGRALLRIAKDLNRSTAEPWKRSVINRAYYAAFGEASSYATRNGYTGGGGGSPHKSVWDFIERVADHDRRRRAKRAAIRAHARWMQEEREKADYRLAAGIGRDVPDEAIRYAKRIIDTLDELRP
jgi:hypothetical protein